MGSSGSTKRVSFEADENDQITVVKGIRLSESVINRMRDNAPSAEKSQPSPTEQTSSGTSPPSVKPLVANEMRKQISEELAQERTRQDLNLQKRLEHDKRYVHDEIGKILESERNAANDSLVKAVLRERTLTEEERMKSKQASAQFYKLTTEEYQKAVSDVESKFKRYKSQPICAELQEDVLRCYQQNPGQTLSCSALAKQYVHCINYAKQSLLGKGG
ncbi:coiled-coil-helix-coiled-coil-helix domain containing 3a isoform X3 [Narcine bancroftii]|uniref:coiled-coil-helix-coiled-coil-helix domain containing 3a isoform X3 n=1 Tax=Narcine bancroftii TaxID=1343680 RepID=UPI0038315E78